MKQEESQPLGAAEGGRGPTGAASNGRGGKGRFDLKLGEPNSFNDEIARLKPFLGDPEMRLETHHQAPKLAILKDFNDDLRQFRDLYTHKWLIKRHNHQPPVRVPQDLKGIGIAA